MVEEIALALAWQADDHDPANAVVEVLARAEDVALARLWIAGPGDLCGTCAMRAECPNRTRCLHLAASAGSPREGAADWTRTDGRWRRLPLGVGKVGRVGTAGTAVLLHDMSPRSNWIVDPAWAAREGIRSFAAQPLVAGESVMGVLGVFRRTRTDAPAFAVLRRVADHAAAAIVRFRRARGAAQRMAALERENARLRAGTVHADAAGEVPVLTIGEWRRHERANLEAALRRSGGRVYGSGGAAELLGVPPTTLASRLKALGIPTPGRRGGG